jgi:hypothetical protein
LSFYALAACQPWGDGYLTLTVEIVDAIRESFQHVACTVYTPEVAELLQ